MQQQQHRAIVEKGAAIRCIAIAYDWFLTPPDFDDFDTSVIIASKESIMGESDDTSLKKKGETSVYHTKLESRRSIRHLTDISGTIGLLYSASGQGTEGKAAAFERLIADAIIWELSKYNYQVNSTAENDGKTLEKIVVLIQGPMLPKLRGRLLYRGIPEHITIYAITYQPQWLRQIESATSLVQSLNGCANQISAVFPPVGIDRATRSWIYKLNDRCSFHVETTTNSLACVKNPTWEAVCRSEILYIMKNCSDLSRELMPLPAPLDQVLKMAKDRRKNDEKTVWFLGRLREVDHDPNLFASGSVERTMAEIIDPSLKKLLDAASTGKKRRARQNQEINDLSSLSWSNEEEIYQRSIQTNAPRNAFKVEYP